MALLRPTSWTTQPQQVCEIDWSNPISRGLSIAVIPNGNSARELTLSTLSAKVGSPSTSIGQRGVASVGSGGTNYFTFIDHDKYDLVGPITVIAVVDGISGGVSGGYLSKGPIDTANTPFFFGRSGAIISLSRGGASDYQRFNTTNTVTVPDAPCVFGVTQNGVLGSGATCNYYLNGTTPGSSAGGGMANTVATANALPVRFAGTVEKVYLSFAFNRVLSDAEIKSLSANPWQIFKPLPRRIFAPVAASSDHLIIGANSSQTNTTAQGAIGQTHLATISNSAQANTASDGAINQTHLVSVASSNQSNVASDATISQSSIVYVTASDSAQENTASQVAINQTHLVSVASSNQANTASDVAIQQTHLVSVSTSNQANVASQASITQALDKFVTAADSAQANIASAGSIQQTHLIQCAGVAIDNVASASAVVQEHLVGVANSVQTNTASSAFIYSGAEAPSKETITLDSPITLSLNQFSTITQRRNLASPITPRVDLISRL